MNLYIVKELKDNIYSVTVKTEDFSSSDLSLLQDFTEPFVDVGGAIPGVAGASYTIPSKQIKIKSEFPYTISFAKSVYSDAEDRANDWATEISSRIDSALTTLRNLSDTFSGTTTTVI